MLNYFLTIRPGACPHVALRGVGDSSGRPWIEFDSNHIRRGRAGLTGSVVVW